MTFEEIPPVSLTRSTTPGADRATFADALRGWERLGSELTDNRVDHREQIDVCTEHPPHPLGVEPDYLRLDGPNQWLGHHILPGFRGLVERFHGRPASTCTQTQGRRRTPTVRITAPC